jgi:lipopolysaccharide biosynthesis protein
VSVRPPDSAFLQGIELHRLENRGRDILPFLTAMERTKFEFEFALKLHTKRSPHMIDGAEWRRMLIGDLLPRNGCSEIVELFKRDPNIGFLSPDEHWVPIREFIGSNREGICRAAGRLGYDFCEREVETARFIAGSMFWFRKEALRPFVESDIRDLFEPESGQLDGTTAHAIERLFSYIGEANAFVSVNVGQVRQLLRRLNGRRYPLQDRMDRFSEYQVHITRKRRIALSPSDDAVSDTGHDEQAEHGRLGVSGGRERIRALARNRLLYGVYERLPWRIRLQIRRVLGLRS